MIVKTYLSRAQSRALALEHPVGDPTGGAAYRQMRAPAAAVIGMVTSFSSMAAGSIMAGIAFAGSALSLVGSLTGNKTLSTIGMVAGGIGGAGMAGLFGEGVQAATWGGGLGEAAASGSTAAASLSQSAAPAPGNLAPVVDGAQSFPVAPPTDMAATPLADVGAGAVSPSMLNSPGASGMNGPVPGMNVPGTGPLPTGGGPLAQSPGAPSAVSPVEATGQGTGLIESVSNAGKGVAGFIKENPELAKIMASGAGGLANYLSGIPDAQLDALQAQTGYADARAMQIQEEIERERRRRANLNAGYQQVDQRIHINPNASMAQQPPTTAPVGLIAGAQGR